MNEEQKSLIEKEKEKVEFFKGDVKISEFNYRIACSNFDFFEKQFKKAKKQKNRLYTDWKNERIKLKKATARMKSLLSRIRRWGKVNPGKVMNRLFEEKKGGKD